jgi:SAM-dependent methyltransferase
MADWKDMPRSRCPAANRLKSDFDRLSIPLGDCSKKMVEALCPVCAKQDVEVYSEGDDKQLVSSAIGSSRKDVSHGKILRCKVCRFGFRLLRPPEEQLSSLYRELDPEIYEKESLSRSKTANCHLRIVERYIPGGELLDVGCASGVFLGCAVHNGWKVVGVEPSKLLCDKAKKLIDGRGRILCLPLQQADLPPSSFDAVTLWDVLEHVLEPVGFLERCAMLLKPGGYLFINVPDLDSLPARILGERWPLLLAEHLNYFNRSSLRLCGDRAHLQWIKFGRRPAWFSLKYVLYRMAQHRIPGSSMGHGLVSGNLLGKVTIPAFLGESYGIWRRPKDCLVSG